MTLWKQGASAVPVLARAERAGLLSGDMKNYNCECYPGRVSVADHAPGSKQPDRGPAFWGAPLASWGRAVMVVRMPCFS